MAALSDVVTRLEPSQPALCQAQFFIELVARVWKVAPGGADHNARINATVAELDQLAGWLGKDGLIELKEGQSLSKQVLDIFTAVRTRIPKNVFLARWYPTAADGEEVGKAKLRLKQIQDALKEIEKEEGTHLELIDMGTQSGRGSPSLCNVWPFTREPSFSLFPVIQRNRSHPILWIGSAPPKCSGAWATKHCCCRLSRRADD